MKKILVLCAIAASLAMLALGCGGGGSGATGGSPTPTLTTLTLYSEPSLDGDVYKYFSTPNTYSYHADRTYINVGHEATGDPFHVSIRSLVSFDISALPVGAVIHSATFRIYKIGGNGDDFVYTILGNLLLDHVFYTTLSSDLYELAALETLSTPLATSRPDNGTWRELEVSSQVRTDIGAGRSHAQFRLRFNKEVPDDGSDYSSYYENWTPGDNPTEKPELIITYSI